MRRIEGPETRLVQTLGEGAFFGEAALLTGEPRNATVIAREDTEVYTLNKEDFQTVVKAIASFEEELRKALFQRQ